MDAALYPVTLCLQLTLDLALEAGHLSLYTVHLAGRSGALAGGDEAAGRAPGEAGAPARGRNARRGDEAPIRAPREGCAARGHGERESACSYYLSKQVQNTW